MGIYFFQNTSTPKYRVMRTVNGKVHQSYFDHTPAGLVLAEAEDQRLKRLQQSTKTAAGGRYHFAEHGDKRFKTGVLNITLKMDEVSLSPVFKLGILLECGRQFGCSRSIRKHGYKKAWEECCEALWHHYEIDDPVPPPPSVNRARRHLRSLGAPEEFVELVTLKASVP